MIIAGVQWDEGNWPKCGKHGVSREEIEELLRTGRFAIYPARSAADEEARDFAIGRTQTGRWLLVVFTLRLVVDRAFIRPISARYMHRKEVEHYGLQTDSQAPPEPKKR